MLKKLLFMVMVFLVSTGMAYAQTGNLTGTVTDAETGEVLPGANVIITELTRGAATNTEGEYLISDIPVGTYEVVVSFIGFNQQSKTVTISAGEETVANFELSVGINLDEVVVTALGQKASKNSISFASQKVSTEQLNIAPVTNVKTSLAGKVAGVQIVGQAGSKLGSFGHVRIRGTVSMTDALSDPLYVLDGVPVSNPNIIDMNNVASVTVLKGPNATALYGQRGDNGVILLQSKSSRAQGVSVSLTNSLTIQEVAYLPNYQNRYGQGYNGETTLQTFNYDPSIHPSYFKALDGVRYNIDSDADASWGAMMDGEPYAPWYVWFPDSPYYGQEVPYKAHPNNIKNFFSNSVRNKAGFAINAVGADYSTRVSYSNLNTNGLIPYSKLEKHFISANFDYDVTDDFSVNVNFNYTLQDVNGDVRADGYSENMTSSSFNQWFGRNLSTQRMKELMNLKTPEGYLTSWNWFGPNDYGKDAAHKKAAFWFNPYKYMKDYNIARDRDNLLFSLGAAYEINDQWQVSANGSTTRELYHRRFEFPYIFEYSSAASLYMPYANSFGIDTEELVEYNYNARVNYNNNFGVWTVDAMAGGTIRDQHFSNFQADMDMGNPFSGGLIIPNVYQFSNSAERIIPNEYNWNKRVYSLYGKATIGYEDMIYLDATYRQDWSSALPTESNGYGYPSFGLSFVFTELMESDVLSYGKVRAGWAQVGNDVDAERIIQSYRLSGNAYTNPATGISVPLLYTSAVRIDPDIKPALNSSLEAGFDLRFFDSRLGLSATYYQTTREDEIVGISLSSTTGYTSFLTNAGSVEGKGLEISLNGIPFRTQDFRWDVTLNWAANQSVVTELPGGLDTYELDSDIGASWQTNAFGFVFLTHKVGEEWGQLRGTAIKRDEQGRPIILSSGLYATESGHFFGSVLPDWTGGLVNSFSYKNINLTAAIDFQKGGKFFSLSEAWGTYTGLYEETANYNDKGNLKRDPVSEGGGVHVIGVDPSGNPVDMYVSANNYYHQWYANRLAEPFVHDASYMKLREVSLSYTLPKEWLGTYLQSATIGVVARNIWMIALSGENHHGWDPSELAEPWGENAQLPGTRSYGVNVKVTF